MTRLSSLIFRAVLVLLGFVNVLLGINLAFGGIQTLGWQGTTDFLTITKEYEFLIHDSHTRFFGGLYIGIGLYLIAATSNLEKYRMALALIFGITFLGGMARLTIQRSDVVLGPDIIGSLAAELVLMPLLYFWMLRILKART
ncbi:MAG: DUF4345 domain-containing protein [bacterium]|nr:DUF4345 domain-containing protein [bacterium]